MSSLCCGRPYSWNYRNNNVWSSSPKTRKLSSKTIDRLVLDDWEYFLKTSKESTAFLPVSAACKSDFFHQCKTGKIQIRFSVTFLVNTSFLIASKICIIILLWTVLYAIHCSKDYYCELLEYRHIKNNNTSNVIY